MNLQRWTIPSGHAVEEAWRWAVLILFGAYFAIGLASYADYGMSTDEVIQRHHGLVSLKHILSLLNVDATGTFAYLARIPDLATYPHRSYGVVFHLPLLLIEHFVRDRVPMNVLWQIRHLYTFCWFFVGAIYFYRLARFWFTAPVAVVAALLLVTSPRIYADSFYNVKDTTFLAFFNVALFYGVSFMKRADHIGALKFALSVAVMLNVRFFGVFLPAFVGGLMLIQVGRQPRDRWLSGLKPLLTLTAFSVVFTWMIWPAAWAHPLTFFVDTFILSTNYDKYTGIVLYMGVRHPGSELPWQYIPHWILISTPVAPPGASCGFTAGTAMDLEHHTPGQHADADRVAAAGAAGAACTGDPVQVNAEHQLAPLLFPAGAAGLAGAFVAAVSAGPAHRGRQTCCGQDGRHHRSAGVDARWSGPIRSGGCTGTILISRSSSIASGLTGRKQDFQLDGWNLSARQGIEHIASMDARSLIYVHSYVVEKQFLLIDADIQKRLRFSRYSENADYIVDTNHWSRTHPPATGTWQDVYQLRVDGVVVMRIWKKLAEATP